MEDGGGGRDCKVSTRVFTDLVASFFSRCRRYEFHVFGIRGNQTRDECLFSFRRFLENVNGVSFSIFLLLKIIVEN